MTTKLFYKPQPAEPAFEKVAYAALIEEPADKWGPAILTESYKALPFLTKYETALELERVDGARGFGVGKIVVWPAQTEKRAAAENGQLVVLPIIVRERELAPLDVFSHRGQWFPLAQEKLAEVLLRGDVLAGPAPADMTQDANMTGMTRNPAQDNRFFGGGSMLKTASAAQYVPTNAQLDDLAAHLRSSPSTTALVAASPVRAALQGYLERASTEKTAAAASQGSLALFTRNSSGVDMVLRDADGSMSRTHVSAAQAAEALGDLAPQLFEDNWAVLSERERDTVVLPPLQKVASSVEDVAGVYGVQRGMETMEAVVVPRVVSPLSGLTPRRFVYGPDVYGLQEKVAGVFLRPTNIQGSDAPEGTGVFLFGSNAGMSVSTPMQVKYAGVVGGVPEYLIDVGDGDAVPLRRADNLRMGIVKTAGAVYVTPSARWLRLDHARDWFEESDEAMSKIASSHIPEGSDRFEVVGSDRVFSINGAGAFGPADTTLLLAAQGMTVRGARELVKLASEGLPAIAYVKQVETEKTASVSAAVERVEYTSPVRTLELMRSLAIVSQPAADKVWPDTYNGHQKVAAAVRQDTINDVLSLQFVTPENASIYVNFLPNMEKAASHLAEILVASRLGMDDVREAAAKNAMEQVSAVVRGLKGLQMKVS